MPQTHDTHLACSFVAACASLNPEWGNREQQDAGEFLRFLLEKLGVSIAGRCLALLSMQTAATCSSGGCMWLCYCEVLVMSARPITSNSLLHVACGKTGATRQFGLGCYFWKL